MLAPVARHPYPVPIDVGVQHPAATVLLHEGVERGEQVKAIQSKLGAGSESTSGLVWSAGPCCRVRGLAPATRRGKYQP